MRGAMARLVLALLATGCSELGELDRGVCGNGFVEPEAGEDCDGAASDGVPCRSAGEPFECRWDCSGEPGSEPACPTGTRCGQDGVCRAFSGFASSAITISEPLSGLVVGELDGDGRDDLVASAGDDVVIHHFGANAAPSDERRLSTERDLNLSKFSPLPITLGELSNDGLDEVIAPHLFGFVVRLGTEDRSERVTAHPAGTFPSLIEDVGAVMVDVLPTTKGDELVLFGALGGVSGLVYFDLSSGTQATPQLLTTLPGSYSEAIVPVLVGDLDTRATSPCEEMVIAYEAAPELVEFSPCRVGPAGIELAIDAPLRTLKLPAGRVATTTAALIDLNADQRLDVVVGARAGNAHEIAVGYGVGDGSIHSDDSTLPLTDGDDQLVTLIALGTGAALAIGHLNDDATLDWVHPTGIRVSSAAGHVSAFEHLDAPWTRALIDQFNSGADRDVVATNGSDELLFLNGVGHSAFSPFRLKIGGEVRRLAAGDFDGDAVKDVALSRVAGEAAEMFAVAYGSSIGGPSAPIDVGLLDPIEQILVGRASRNGVIDGNDDLIVVSKEPGGEINAALLAGTSTRRLRAPFVLTRVDPNTGVTVAYPTLAASVGQFTDDDHTDVAVLTRLFSDEQTYRLFLVPALDEARLRAGLAVETPPLAAEVDWSRAHVLRIDPNGDGLDEVVLLGPARNGSGGFLQLAHPTFAGSDRFLFELGPLEAFALAVCTDPAEIQPCGAIVRDLDQDGVDDLAALGRAASGEPVLAVWYSDDGLLSQPVLLDSSVQAMVDVQIGAHAQLFALAGSSIRAVLIGVDRSLSLGGDSVLDAVSATRLTSGDLDGDGVADLITWGASGVGIHRGVPRHE